MMKHISIAMTAALLLVLATAQPVRADWLLTPYLGTTFGGDDDRTQRLTYGAAIGWMGAGAFGFELDAGITPRFFDTDAGAFDNIEDSNVTTLMGNVIAGIPLGAPGVRPYVTGGAGILRTRATSLGNVLDLNENHFGVNVGGGVMGFVTENVGIRGDVRYFRDLQDSDSGSNIDLDLGGFNFWRTTVGATIRF